jgi:hypothetical protein
MEINGQLSIPVALHPGIEHPKRICRRISVGLTVSILCEEYTQPCRVSSPGREPRYITILPSVMSVETLLVTGAIRESGMQAFDGRS